MRKPRTRTVVIVAVAAVFATYCLLCYLNRSQPSGGEAIAVVRAAGAFAQARVQGGQPRPTSVQMADLLKAGLVRRSTAQRFVGSEIVLPETGDETRPQVILVQLRLRDGRVFLLLADGSAQQLAQKTQPPL